MAADLKVGTIVRRQRLSPILEIFDLAPEEGSRFPKYQSGQYIALRRDQCRLTKEVVGKDGRKRYVPDLDASGNPKLGPVTHSYSIASGRSRLAIVISMVSGQPSFQYVSDVPHCSQNCRSTCGEDA